MNYCIADKNGRIYTDLIYCCENCWGWRGWKWEQDSTDKTNTALWDCKHGPIIAGFPSIVSASAVHSCRFWSTINGEIAMLTLKLVCLDLRNITASKGRRAVHTSCSSGPPPPEAVQRLEQNCVCNTSRRLSLQGLEILSERTGDLSPFP